MKTTEIFIKAVEHMLSMEPKGAQGRLADKLNIQRTSINDFLKGRRNFSEERKEKLSEILGSTYIEMLNLGQKLLYKEKDISPTKEKILPQKNDIDKHQDKLHAEVIKGFKQKDLAKECNMKMVELEKLDPKSLEKVREFLDFQLYEKRKSVKRKSKKKVNGM